MLTDTHCHLTAPELRFRLPEIIAQAAQAEVRQFIVPSACQTDWCDVLALQQQPEIRAVAVGIHPWFADAFDDAAQGSLNNILAHNPQVWVGEIGLDNVHATPMETQQIAFRLQLRIAQQFSRPVIVHNVKASAHIAQLIREERFTQGGIIHAFSGSLEEANVFIKQGFKIGIGSLLLRPHAKKARLAAQHLPLNSIVLETDSPYMQPENRNTPAHLRQIAQTVADLRGIHLHDLADACERNIRDLLLE